MSGIGGVGFMTIWSAKEQRAWTVDYGPISAKKLDLANYKIVGPGPANPFAWPDILEQRNEVGYHSIAVPGMVAGLGKALERFGTHEVEGRAGARRRARRARHGARLVHAGDDRQRRQAPLEVPGLEGRLSLRRRPRADQRLAGQHALPQARQSRRDHASAGRRRPARISTKAASRATSPPTCRPAARRSPTTISRPTRPASSIRCRSSITASPSMSRAASPPARRCAARSSSPATAPRARARPTPISSSPSPRACTPPTTSG